MNRKIVSCLERTWFRIFTRFQKGLRKSKPTSCASPKNALDGLVRAQRGIHDDDQDLSFILVKGYTSLSLHPAIYGGYRVVVSSTEYKVHFSPLCCCLLCFCRPLFFRRISLVHYPVDEPGLWRSRSMGRLRPQHVGGEALLLPGHGSPNAQTCVICLLV